MQALANIKEKASSGIHKAANAVGIETKRSEDSEVSTIDELSELCPKLTFQQRIIGFGSCFVLGYFITFMSFSLFLKLVLGNPVPFVLVYSFGNMLSLLSFMFLCGPKTQFKKMFDEKRRVTTCVYLSTLTVSIIICFIPFNHKAKLSILVVLLFVQMGASIWYSLSYIPFARKAVKQCFKNSIGYDQV